MSTIGAVEIHDGFIEIILEGKVETELPNAISVLQEAMTLCREHQCSVVLLNGMHCTYAPYLSILAEHELIRFFSSTFKRPVKLALLVPKAVAPNFLPLETAGRNRGIAVRVFRDRNRAITWLMTD